MSLEQALIENTAAVKELISTLKANGGTTTAAAAEEGTTKATNTGANKKTAADKKPAAKKAEGVDAATLKAKLVEYKELTSLADAKALTAKLGFNSIADVPDEKSKEVYDGICAAIVALDNANTADAEDEEEL